MLGQKSPPKTALDYLTFSEPDKSRKQILPNCNEGDYASSGEDVEDLVFCTAIQPGRTGDFDLDFPKSPKVSTGKGKKGKKGTSSTQNDNNVPSIEIAGNKKVPENPRSEEPLVVKINSKEIGVNTSLQDDTTTQHIVVVKETVVPIVQGKENLIDTSDEFWTIWVTLGHQG